MSKNKIAKKNSISHCICTMHRNASKSHAKKKKKFQNCQKQNRLHLQSKHAKICRTKTLIATHSFAQFQALQKKLQMQQKKTQAKLQILPIVTKLQFAKCKTKKCKTNNSKKICNCTCNMQPHFACICNCKKSRKAKIHTQKHKNAKSNFKHNNLGNCSNKGTGHLQQKKENAQICIICTIALPTASKDKTKMHGKRIGIALQSMQYWHGKAAEQFANKKKLPLKEQKCKIANEFAIALQNQNTKDNLQKLSIAKKAQIALQHTLQLHLQTEAQAAQTKKKHCKKKKQKRICKTIGKNKNKQHFANQTNVASRLHGMRTSAKTCKLHQTKQQAEPSKICQNSCNQFASCKNNPHKPEGKKTNSKCNIKTAKKQNNNNKRIPCKNKKARKKKKKQAKKLAFSKATKKKNNTYLARKIQMQKQALAQKKHAKTNKCSIAKLQNCMSVQLQMTNAQTKKACNFQAAKNICLAIAIKKQFVRHQNCIKQQTTTICKKQKLPKTKCQLAIAKNARQSKNSNCTVCTRLQN